MRVTITARHCEVSDELPQRAREVLGRLEKVAARAHTGRVTFVEEHGEPSVELQVHTVRGQVYVARASGTDHRTALDRAADRMRRQLGRAPARRRTRQRAAR